jgi:hypothetical protein
MLLRNGPIIRADLMQAYEVLNRLETYAKNSKRHEELKTLRFYKERAASLQEEYENFLLADNLKPINKE